MNRIHEYIYVINTTMATQVRVPTLPEGIFNDIL